ncbi:hypothetical protein J7J00_00870 [Bacillus sp. ISL-4]|nr:hypothetical protein [Bacillus sp. ISL-4]MBT2664060.1 hypothetical protein [Bacillus sp. ISL-4]MBT2672552.1 hypothetical protein [Streptomyces sp. ISL-14]
MGIFKKAKPENQFGFKKQKKQRAYRNGFAVVANKVRNLAEQTKNQ